MRSTRSSLKLLLGGSIFAVVTAAGQPAAAQTAFNEVMRTYDIPRQSLGLALNKFAERSGVQMMFDPAVVRDKRNASLSGRYRTNVALAQLLRGSGLTARSGVDGTIVIAQASVAGQVGNGSSAAPSEANPPEEAEGIADIVVTASRRAENVQRSALSIQAFTSEALTRANVTKPEDLNSIAPGVQIGTGGNYPQVYIRGVGNYATNALAEGAVAFNLDGVYISQSQATRGMFFDLERVEVLKGPQGTLYGRNASGGAVNVITAKPKLGQISGFVEGQAGNYQLFQGIGAINLPLGDTVAVRASGQLITRDGYLTDGYIDDKQQSGRLQLLWKPSVDFSLLLQGNYQHTGGKGAGSVLNPQLPGNKFRGASDPAVAAIFRAQPGIGSLLTYPRDDGYLDVTVRTVGAELNWDFGPATLTVLPAYRDSILRDSGYVPGFSVTADQRDKQTSVEVRLSNENDAIKWVVGGYYFNEQQNNRNGRPSQIVRQGISGQITSSLDLNTRSYALFGQATMSVTDRLRLTGGIRYTYERKVIDQLLKNFTLPIAGSAPPRCATGAVFTPTAEYAPGLSTAPLFCVRTVPVAGRLTFNQVTWKAGVEFDVAPNSFAYASVSTGFKSGGFFSAPAPNTFEPEKLTAFEAGVKNRFLDNRLQVNVEAFYWRYLDHQETSIGATSIPGYVAQLTYNAGKAKSYGMELDVIFRPTPADNLRLTAQYNKTNYDSFTYRTPSAPVTGCAVASGVVDCSGFPLIRAPKWTGTASYSHTFDLGGGKLTPTADVQFSSKHYLTTDFIPLARQRGYAMGNFDLTYAPEGGRWVVSAFVRNIWDEKVLTQSIRSPFVTTANPLANPGGLVVGTVRPPRTYGGRVRFNF